MPYSKPTKSGTPKEIWEQRIKNAIWTCEAFNFDVSYALKWINSGLLGYKTNGDGMQILDKAQKPIPITIGRTAYFRYKKQFSELPEIFNDLRAFAAQGYTKLLYGFQEELAVLHQLSAQNLLTLKEPLERQQIIDSMVKNVIPTQNAFADMLKKLLDAKKITEPKKEEAPIAKH